MNKSEPTAMLSLKLASGFSLFAAALAIILGWQGAQLPAAVSLAFAIAGAVFAVVAYRRYLALRRSRWQQELADGEEQLKQIFEENNQTQ